MTATTAAPCLSCRTTGGYVQPGRSRPARKRGLCHVCAARAVRRGIIHRYPACGAVPVPRQQRHDPNWYDPTPWRPAPWAATCDDPARCELPTIAWATLTPTRAGATPPRRAA